MILAMLADDLHYDRRRHGLCIWTRMSVDAQPIDKCFVARDVSTGGTEALRECAHQDIDAAWVDAKEIRHAAAVGSQGTDGVCFVDVEVKLYHGISDVINDETK